MSDVPLYPDENEVNRPPSGPGWSELPVQTAVKPPLIFYLSGVLGGIVIVSGVIGLLVGLLSYGKTVVTGEGLTQLGALGALPTIVLYVGQMALITGGLVWVIRKTKAWNVRAIMAGAVLAPLLLMLAASALQQLLTGEGGKALPGAPVAPILMMAFYWLFAGVVAYHDIYYRKPTVQGMR